ncbi:MAG: response regulator [Limisphaerales bacterium]
MRQQEILLAEPQAIVARDMERMLVRHGYHVTGVVGTGDEAVEAVSSMRVDLVLLDMDLPGMMNGVEAAGMIQGEYGTPVVFLGSNPNSETIEQAKFTDPYGYIVKPVGERDLCAGIELALYRYQNGKMLDEKEKWLESILTQLGEGVIATDHDGRIYLYNHAAERILGREPEDVLRQSVTEVMPLLDEDRRFLDQDVFWHVQTKEKVKDWSGQAHVATAKGLVAIEFTAAAIRGSGGQFQGATIVFRKSEGVRLKKVSPDDSSVAI